MRSITLRQRPGLLWLPLAALLLVSIGIKSTSALNRAGDASIRDLTLDWIAGEARAAGLVPQFVGDLTARGTFQVQVFTHAFCPAARLALLPMYRNSEGARLLEDRLDTNQSAIFYSFGGHRFQQFPAVAFWAGRHLERLRRLAGSKPKPSFYSVIAFAKSGTCERFAPVMAKLGA